MAKEKGNGQVKIDLKELKERFSLNAENVDEEIKNCPHDAVGDTVVVMPYQPNYKTKLNIIFTDVENEPSYKKVPMGWVVSIGESAQKVLGIKAGDLVKWAGTAQQDYTNEKVYLIMHRINVLGKMKIDKVKTWTW